ncbi:MAG: restriction endonuclease subunit S, partial [Dysgonamonadaceae bacterium]|nr:restriction endonuclease subunit S [Dysgonamonadaceae bacterium]
MKPYPKYKTTNIPWLQEVPEGWEVISLRKFLIPISEKNQPQMRLLSVVRERGVIERDIENDDNHNVIPEDLSNYKVVKRGQFVMNKMKAWQGSYGVSDYDGIVSPAYYVFDLQFGNKKYFHYGLRSRFFIDLFARFSIGIRTDQWDLPIQKIKEIPVPFPPLSIQAQIVNFLDTKVSAIDRLIDAKRRQIELLKEWKRAAINEELSANYANSRENLISENSRNSRTKIKNVPLKRLLAEPLQYGANESGKEYNENLPRYVRITDITLDGQLKS